MTAQKVASLISMLKEEGTDQLNIRYGVSVKYHKLHPSLAQFKYDQVKSDLNHPIPQVCRGIILDTSDNYRVVALPYTKFFNYGEGPADPIDWTTARVYEKLDGSIITLYWHKDNWHVASSGLPDASGKCVGFRRLHGKAKSTQDPIIRDEFWRIWKEKNYKLPTDTTKCFMFELLLSNHRNIVFYEDRIVLHGARDLTTLEEIDPLVVAKEYEWECAKVYPVTSIEGVLELAKKINPSEGEGFVVADAQFRRVKVKSPQYVALSLLSESKPELNQMRFLEIIRANEGPEFLAYFPHFNDLFNTLKTKYERMCADYDCKLASLRAQAQGDMRVFGRESQKLTKFPWVFFACQKSAQSVREVFANTDLKILDQMMMHFEKEENAKIAKERVENEKIEEVENAKIDKEENGETTKKSEKLKT